MSRQVSGSSVATLLYIWFVCSANVVSLHSANGVCAKANTILKGFALLLPPAKYHHLGITFREAHNLVHLLIAIYTPGKLNTIDFFFSLLQ